MVVTGFLCCVYDYLMAAKSLVFAHWLLLRYNLLLFQGDQDLKIDLARQQKKFEELERKRHKVSKSSETKSVQHDSVHVYVPKPGSGSCNGNISVRISFVIIHATASICIDLECTMYLMQ